MIMDNYKKDYERATYLLSVYDRLKSCGISEKSVHHFAPFGIDSGYSMGEVTRIQCEDRLIIEHDTRTYYKGRAKRYNTKVMHGYTCVNFSKKDLRKFIELRIELYVTPINARRFEIYDELQRLIFSAIDCRTIKHILGFCKFVHWSDL